MKIGEHHCFSARPIRRRALLWALGLLTFGAALTVRAAEDPPIGLSEGVAATVPAAPQPAAETAILDDSASADRESLRIRLAALNPFRAQFVQVVEGARGQVLEESTGEIALQRPNFRWQVDAPYPQLIVADGEQLSIYDPDLEQVILRDLDTALADTPIALLTQSKLKLSERFEVQQVPSASPTDPEVFLLAPLDPDSLYQEVQLHFLDSTLKQLLIYDHLGQATTVRFSPMAVEEALAPSLFQLELPAGVDVIEG